MKRMVVFFYGQAQATLDNDWIHMRNHICCKTRLKRCSLSLYLCRVYLCSDRVLGTFVSVLEGTINQLFQMTRPRREYAPACSICSSLAPASVARSKSNQDNYCTVVVVEEEQICDMSQLLYSFKSSKIFLNPFPCSTVRNVPFLR